MDKPLVSIITPVFNSGAFINETYKSINSQTYLHWEWLVVDDCSTDSSFQIASCITRQDQRVRVFKNSENLGAGGSRNKAISEANGQYIAFLDSDDLWLPRKLEKQIDFMQTHGYALTYTQYQKFNASGDLGIVIPPNSVTYKQLLYSNVIGCLTAVYDVDQLGKRYMPLIRKRQDMGLWISILKDIPHAYCLQENLAKYRVDSGMTKDKITVLSYQWRFYREVMCFNVFRSAYTFLVYAYRGFIKSRI